jgi:2'-5' RNA ligase
MTRRRTTGLVVPVEGARRLVERWLYLIPTMSRDVPPHVTVLWPFLAPDDVDEVVERRPTELFAGEAPFEVGFNGFGRFLDAVFLRPEPVARQRRRCSPYSGSSRPMPAATA